jgi:hypothetical protein
LGKLPEEQYDAIEEKLFSDESFLATIEQVEDEIIDEYLEDSLSAADKQAVEDHFLQSADRMDKLQFARLLRSRIQTKKKQSSAFDRGWRVIKPAYFYGMSAAAVALLAICVGLLMNNLGLQRKLDSEIAREQTMQASLSQQLREAQLENAELKKTSPTSGNVSDQQAGPTYLALNLNPIQPRGIESAIRLKLNAGTRGIEIHLPLLDAPFSSYYKAVLRTASGKELVSVAKIKPSRARALSFRITYPQLQAGNYALALTGYDLSGQPIAASPKIYDFTLEK